MRIREKIMKNEKGLIGILLIMICAGLFALLVYGSVLEEKEWEQYKIDHNCEIKGKQAGSTSIGVGPNVGGGGGVAVVPVFSGEKTIYICDNEEIFIR